MRFVLFSLGCDSWRLVATIQGNFSGPGNVKLPASLVENHWFLRDFCWFPVSSERRVQE